MENQHVVHKPFKVYVRYCEDYGVDVFTKPVDTTTKEYLKTPLDTEENLAHNLCLRGFCEATGLDEEEVEHWDLWREFTLQWKRSKPLPQDNAVPFIKVVDWIYKLCESVSSHAIEGSEYYLYILKIEVVQ